MKIDQEELEKIKNSISFAENNPYTSNMLMKIIDGTLPYPGINPDRICEFKCGIKTVFTVDEGISLESGQKVWCKHLSVSHNGKLPSPFDVNTIMNHYGFRNQINIDPKAKDKDLVIYIESDPNPPFHPFCVHIVEELI